MDLFCIFEIFLLFCIFCSKLPRLLLKVTEVTTEHKKWPKISTNSVKSLGRSPMQELQVSPLSGLYLLVFVIIGGLCGSIFCIVDIEGCLLVYPPTITGNGWKIRHCSVDSQFHVALGNVTSWAQLFSTFHGKISF